MCVCVWGGGGGSGGGGESSFSLQWVNVKCIKVHCMGTHWNCLVAAIPASTDKISCCKNKNAPITTAADDIFIYLFFFKENNRMLSATNLLGTIRDITMYIAQDKRAIQILRTFYEGVFDDNSGMIFFTFSIKLCGTH